MKKRIHLFNRFLLNGFCVPGPLFSVEIRLQTKQNPRWEQFGGQQRPGHCLRCPGKNPVSMAEKCGEEGRRWNLLKNHAVLCCGHCRILAAYKNNKQKEVLGW